MADKNNKPLDWRSALARIRQERSDVGKALAATQGDLATDLTKEGTARGWGAGIGKYAGPIVLDWAIGALLDSVVPGVGRMYQAAKGVPILKAGGTALYSGIGTKVGADIGGKQVDVRNVEPLMEKWLDDTISGQRASRFDRGGTESLASQRELQLDVLDDLINQTAIKNAGSAFLKSITGDVMDTMGEQYKERLDNIRANRELTSKDYLDVLLEAGGKGQSDKSVIKSLFDFSPLSRDNLSDAGDSVSSVSRVIDEMGSDALPETSIDVDIPSVQSNQISEDTVFNTGVQDSFSRYVNRRPEVLAARGLGEPIGYNKMMADVRENRKRNFSTPSNDYLMNALFSNI